MLLLPNPFRLAEPSAGTAKPFLLGDNPYGGICR